MKILVVDDSLEMRESTVAALELYCHIHGGEVQGASSSQEAIELLNNAQDFDVLITDWDLGHASKVNGAGLARQARCFYPELRIALWSGLTRPAIPEVDLQLTKGYRAFQELLEWLG